MKFRSTLILFVIAICLGVGIFILSKTVPITEEWSKIKKKIVETKAEDIISIEINKGDKQVVCEKDSENNWQVIKPIRVKANAPEIDNTLKEIERASTNKAITSAQNPSDYGFDKPRITFKITTKMNQTHIIKVGKDAALEQGLYIQKEGDSSIYLVDSNFFGVVNKSFADLRDRKVTLINPADVDELTIGPGKRINIVRKDKIANKWVMTVPFAENASPDEVRAALMHIDGLQARSFDEDFQSDFTKYGLDNPGLEIIISSTNQSETIIWGSVLKTDRSRIYAAKKGSENPIITTFCSDYTVLSSHPNRFRDRKIFANIKLDDLAKIETKKEASGNIIGLQRIGSQFIISYPSNIALEATAPADFIKTLNETTIDDFIDDNPTDLAKYGLVSPTIELLLTFTDPARANLKIDFSQISGTNYACLKRSDENRVLKVRDELFNVLKKELLFFRKKAILEIPVSRVVSCTLEKGEVKLICNRHDDQWEMKMFPEGQIKIENISNLYPQLYKCHNITVKEFVEENALDLSKYGLENPGLKIDVVYSIGGNQTDRKIVLVGNKTKDNNFYGKMSDSGLVFVIPADVVVPIDGALSIR
jgi:hypothetical protein